MCRCIRRTRRRVRSGVTVERGNTAPVTILSVLGAYPAGSRDQIGRGIGVAAHVPRRLRGGLGSLSRRVPWNAREKRV